MTTKPPTRNSGPFFSNDFNDFTAVFNVMWDPKWDPIHSELSIVLRCGDGV